MNLEPPSTDTTCVNLFFLVNAVNKFIGSQGYVVVKTRVKAFKKSVTRKTVLRCDQDEKYEAK